MPVYSASSSRGAPSQAARLAKLLQRKNCTHYFRHLASPIYRALHFVPSPNGSVPVDLHRDSNAHIRLTQVTIDHDSQPEDNELDEYAQ